MSRQGQRKERSYASGHCVLMSRVGRMKVLIRGYVRSSSDRVGILDRDEAAAGEDGQRSKGQGRKESTTKDKEGTVA